MKKIISTLLILAMVLTMALTVSAAPGATLSSLMEGDYVIYDPMAQAMGAGDIVIYEISFQKNSLEGGKLTIVDNAATGLSGTYTYVVDDSLPAATITVEAGDTGDSTSASYINFAPTPGGTLSLTLGIPTYDCVVAPAGGGSQGPTGIELVLGANDIDIAIVNSFAQDEAAYFTATEAGTYIISAADGEENEYIGVEGQYGMDWYEAPYQFTLAAGETFECYISTTLPMPNTATSDTINIIITKQGAPAGGGSANTGDSVALYVALGAVALASILGCAIVSKKRVAE